MLSGMKSLSLKHWGLIGLYVVVAGLHAFATAQPLSVMTALHALPGFIVALMMLMTKSPADVAKQLTDELSSNDSNTQNGN